jgi:hypothetical protein
MQGFDIHAVSAEPGATAKAPRKPSKGKADCEEEHDDELVNF